MPLRAAMHLPRALAAAGVATLGLALLGPVPAPADASVLAAGLTDRVVLSHLDTPTAVRFAPDGRIFVAQKRGAVVVYSGVDDTTPRTVIDISAEVHDYGDRGLLGLALSPDFAADPAIYLLYTLDATARWNDGCPTPPGPTTDGCRVAGQLSRVPLSGDTGTGEQVLLTGWCQQFPSHSVGALAFDSTGALLVSGGDGASYTGVDYGQLGGAYAGDAANPCGDPPGAAGTALTPPSAQGGALRAQSLGRPAGPTVLNGTVLRLDPLTGLAAADNPAAGSPDADRARIIASGLRNPFRFTVRPGTDEVWVGDVGWEQTEEIDRIRSTTDAATENFGWPCYEGADPQAGYQSAGLNACRRLVSSPGAVTAPYYAFAHADAVVPGDGCPAGGSSVSGVAFNTGSLYPAAYQGALFFSDFSRNCIWAMARGADGEPDPTEISVVASDAAGPVDLQMGPDGLLYYVGIQDSSLHRIEPGTPSPDGPLYLSSLAWTAMSNGAGPVERDTSVGGPELGDGAPISLDGRAYARGLGAHAASDVRYAVPAGCTGFVATVGVDDDQSAGSVVFRVLVDGVQAFRSGVVTGRTAALPVSVNVTGAGELALQVSPGGDGTAFDDADWADARLLCQDPPDSRPPVVTIRAPSGELAWRVGRRFSFAGSASDPESGPVPAATLTWRLDQHHCPGSCHVHVVQEWKGVASGSFTTADIDYPGWYELVLTAQDGGGAVGTASLRLDPRTVQLTFRSSPSGLDLVVGSRAGTTPFTRTVIVGSSSTVSAPTPQVRSGTTYRYSSWSDSGTRDHSVLAPYAPRTLTATYR